MRVASWWLGAAVGLGAVACAEDPTEVMGPGSASPTEPMAETEPMASADCGNGQLDSEEKCDDGNDDPLDGCTSDCRPGPTGFVLGASLVTAFRGNGREGSRSADECPRGQVLTGLEGQVGDGSGPVRQLRGICGTIGLLYDDGAFGMEVMRGEVLPSHGDSGDIDAEAHCPPGQVVVGFEGANSDMVITELRLQCAPVEVIDTGSDFILERGEITRSAPLGEGAFGAAFPDTSCGTGATGTVVNVQSSDRIHGFGLECAPLALQVGP